MNPGHLPKRPDSAKAAAELQPSDTPPVVLVNLVTPWGTLVISLTTEWTPATPATPAAPPAPTV